MIQSKLLTHLGVTHGYSTRTEPREKFFTSLGIGKDDVVVGQQVHGVRVAQVTDTDKGKTLTGIDALVSARAPIGVTFADCVPILAVAPKTKLVGTAHAGWKGTLKGVALELITALKNAGADVKDIYVSIGPHIGMCCYNVLPDRALAFQEKFGNNEKIAARIEGEWHVDIGYANYEELLDAGIQKDNIDAPVSCTSCQVALFNSFRKDPKEHFGVQLGVIAL